VVITWRLTNSDAFKYSWSDENRDIYYSKTGSLLIPFFNDLVCNDAFVCQDQFCDNALHKHAIECVTGQIASCLLHVANTVNVV
jgi:hypothetical protein